MDWFSWLSKAGLEPSLVYEYGLAFANNELEQDDIPYFNHEFLQSMGISIAKHRLEILKLARKEKPSTPKPISRLLLAIKSSKRCLTSYIRAWVRREESALIVVPKGVARTGSYGSRWKGAMLKRNKTLMVNKQGRLLLTNGNTPLVGLGSRVNSFSSPLIYDQKDQEKIDNDDHGCYWSTPSIEEIKWDTMFQDLKPT
ncbi:uncharacterized protein LOC110821061 [Carica papaya]|uniref:uncharacterized protein LOC110821061 n=1 Tax=Carica papaya TaxID=3649 RepID=UPI000B8C9932|nr:uncharacterized protein LOC110821061 [Carica papaya]